MVRLFGDGPDFGYYEHAGSASITKTIKKYFENIDRGGPSFLEWGPKPIVFPTKEWIYKQ